MGNILFASNNPTHFGPLTTTHLGSHDPARVPYSVQFDNVPIRSPDFKPSPGEHTWMRIRMAGSVIASGSGTGDIFYIFDNQDRLLLRWQKYQNSSTAKFTYYDTDGNTVDSGSASVNSYAFYDFHFHFTAFSMTTEVYLNNVLIGSNTFGANPNNVSAVGYCQWQIKFTESGTGRFSEFIVSDSDTRLARLNMVRPTAVGNYSDWIGAIGTLADNNINTGLTSDTPNDRTSVVMEPYSNNEIISNVVVASQHFRGQNSPSKLRHFLRASGIDYDHGTAFDVDFDASISQTDYKINPATSLPWTLADVAGIEFGFKIET